MCIYTNFSNDIAGTRSPDGRLQTMKAGPIKMV